MMSSCFVIGYASVSPVLFSGRMSTTMRPLRFSPAPCHTTKTGKDKSLSQDEAFRTSPIFNSCNQNFVLFLDRSRHQSSAMFPPIPQITSKISDSPLSNTYSTMNSSHVVVTLSRFLKRRKTYPTNMSSALARHMVASISLFDQP